MIDHQSKIEKLISELCPNGVEFKDLGKIWIKSPKSKLGVAQVKETGKGDIICFTSGKNIFYVDEYLVEGEYIFMNDGGTADTKYNKGKAYYTDHTFTFTVDKTKSIPRFIYFILKENENYINDFLFKGAGLKNLNKKGLEKFKIPIPPLAIQEEIVKILNSFTELEVELEVELEARKKQYEYYFDRIFILNDKFEIKKISEVSNVFDSLHQTPKYSNTGFPMIRVTDIKGGYVDIENTLKVDQKIFETFTKKYKPQFNDIVISRVGSYGNFSLIGNGSDVCLGQNTSIIHPLINAKYLYYALNSKNVTQFVENNVGGGSQKTISLAKIKDIPIPVPSHVEQERIVSILDKFDALVNDILIGLPAELKARRQQYEYYRNKLLTFKELEK